MRRPARARRCGSPPPAFAGAADRAGRFLRGSSCSDAACPLHGVSHDVCRPPLAPPNIETAIASAPLKGVALPAAFRGPSRRAQSPGIARSKPAKQQKGRCVLRRGRSKRVLKLGERPPRRSRRRPDRRARHGRTAAGAKLAKSLGLTLSRKFDQAAGIVVEPGHDAGASAPNAREARHGRAEPPPAAVASQPLAAAKITDREPPSADGADTVPSGGT